MWNKFFQAKVQMKRKIWKTVKYNLSFVEDPNKKVDKRKGAFYLKMFVSKCDCYAIKVIELRSKENRIKPQFLFYFHFHPLSDQNIYIQVAPNESPVRSFFASFSYKFVLWKLTVRKSDLRRKRKKNESQQTSFCFSVLLFVDCLASISLLWCEYFNFLLLKLNELKTNCI
jgi:hypothetical protein